MKQIIDVKRKSELILILWAGSAALLSYSLVYALRKPYTAASFEGLSLMGIDYKVAVTTIQILGYVIAKFFGIKIISELKKENRFRFFVGSAVLAEISLLLFGMFEAPFNAFATDILASLLGVNMVFSSGLSKSVGLFVINDLGIDQFWMPAIIGGVALPLLVFMGYMLKKLPRPTEEDIALRNERVVLDSKGRKSLFLKYAPILTLLFVANFMLLVLRDVKEDFLVYILDMNNQSSWMFARVDTVVTLIVLGILGLFMFCKSNIRVLLSLIFIVVAACLVMTYVSFNYAVLDLEPVVWLFIESLSLYIAYLTFQTIFFDRFIACFRIKGNVGFFIAMIDFIGYMGTVTLLFTKELFAVDVEWFAMFNHIAGFVGAVCAVLFTLAGILIYRFYQKKYAVGKSEDYIINIAQYKTV